MTTISAMKHLISTKNDFRYLQVSGIKVYYKVSNPLGSRVEGLFIQNPDGMNRRFVFNLLKFIDRQQFQLIQIDPLT